MIEQRKGWTVTHDGARLAHTLSGSPRANAPRFVLVHSLALSQAIWEPVVNRLVASVGAHVLTYDCRGHGASDRVPGPYSTELFAGDLLTLLDAVGWGRAIVAGASMGGCVAQTFAVTHGDRVAGLGLVDTTAWYGPNAPQEWAERAHRARDEGLAQLVDFQLSRWFGDEFRAEHADVLGRFAEVFVANDIDCYVATCEMLGGFDVRDAIGGVRAPTAIVVGEDDYATPPAMAAQIHKLIGGSTLEELPGGRHLTLLERPDDVARVLAGLVARTGDT